MKAHLAQFWNRLRSSYWFIPSLMVLAGMALSLAMTALDAEFGAAWLAELGWLRINTPDGARALLGTIAGSMITVAGVTFSITIAAVVHASSQLGPRLLGNFMRDTSNQVTLGMFVTTFIYCLMVLRTVYKDADGNDFVPHMSVLVALSLALASVGVLVYFFHHVPRSIQAAEVIAVVGRNLERRLDGIYPVRLDAAPQSDAEDAAPRLGPGEPLCSDESGYVQNLDIENLLQIAGKHDLILHLLRQPGDFVIAGEPLLSVYGAVPPDAAVAAHIRNAFAFGHERTDVQDSLFIVQQLVQIAARALSPGVNDPFTAINCMDWLGSALVRIGDRRLPQASHRDREGRLRAIVPPLTYGRFADAVFNELRPYAMRDRNAAIHLMEIAERAMLMQRDAGRQRVLLEHADRILSGAATGLDQQCDLDAVTRIHGRIAQRARGGNRPAGRAG